MLAPDKTLRVGKSTNEALRQEHVKQIHYGLKPFYSAGYKLYGDWR